MLTVGVGTFSFIMAGGASYIVHLGNCRGVVLDKRSSRVCVSFLRESSPVKIALYRLTGSLKYSSSKDEDPEEAEVSCDDDRHCGGESSSILNPQCIGLSLITLWVPEALK
jgi:hypothetical protein